ncbi:MAG: glycosyltransferase family 9 protein [Candidatus Omnitrophica bacterium]|nr:glycosyltransferase family 9 protein [Candidatus Omnitrophota bacterium]
MEYKRDCRYFRGSVPCLFKRLCRGCRKYQKITKKILVIKLASAGDVLRTTPLLRALKKIHPGAYMVWLTSKEAAAVLEGNPFIDEVLSSGFASSARLIMERYDWVISLDKAAEAAAIASMVKAQRRSGYGLGPDGRIFPFDKDAEYGFILGLSDDLKFRRNKKSYQEIVFETCGLHFRGEKYVLPFSEKQREFKHRFMKAKRLHNDRLKIGLNTGCGPVFPYKRWTEDGFAGLAERLIRAGDAKVLLLGGAEEEERNSRISRRLGRAVIDSGCGNSLAEFAAIIDCCDVVVSSDTLAMHIAIGLGKKTVCLFGPTCPQEVELYSNGLKISSSLGCAPCYKDHCAQDGKCMKGISVSQVYSAVRKMMAEK